MENKEVVENEIIIIEEEVIVDEKPEVVIEDDFVTESEPEIVYVEVPTDVQYTIDNPLPVVIVDKVAEEEELEVYAATGYYYGTISDTYLDYFEGIVQKLKPSEHYVIWRSGQYAYSMCYGADVSLNGSTFSGSGTLVEIYRDSSSYSSDWYVSTNEDSVSFVASKLFVYSDLGMYPTVERGLSHAEGLALCLAIAVITVYMLGFSIYDYIVKHIYRK